MSTANGLPRGWAVTIISACGEIITGNTPPTTNSAYYGGAIPFAGPSDLNDRPIKQVKKAITDLARHVARIVPPDAVLVSCIGLLGKTGIATEETAFNQQINAVVFDKNVDARFGFYQCQTIRHFLQDYSSATTVPIVNKGKFSQTPFSVAPINEQRRIVAKIEELFSDLDAGVAALERARANLKRYRAAVLKAAVEGSLTAEWRAKHPNVEPASKLLERILTERRRKWQADQLAKFKAARKEPPKGWKDKYAEPKGPVMDGLPELAVGWSWVSADQVCSQITDGEHNQPRYQDAGMPMLTATHVRDGFVTFDDARLIKQDDFEHARKRCGPARGDILIVCVGATTGRAATVGQEDRFALVRSVLLLKPSIDGHYLLTSIRSPWCQQWIRSASGASAQAHFYISDAKRMPVPLAPSVETSVVVAEVAEKLSQSDAADVAIAHGLIRAARLRQSILKRAFEGKLVPQDSRDEPAGEMLARIARNDKSTSARNNKSITESDKSINENNKSINANLKINKPKPSTDSSVRVQNKRRRARK